MNITLDRIILTLAMLGATVTVVPVMYSPGHAVRSVRILVPVAQLEYTQALVPAYITQDSDMAFETESIIDATNKARIDEGLLPLHANAALNASAKAKVEDMIKKGYFDHTTPDGRSVANFVHDAKYSYMVIGENLARGDFVDATDVVREWMKSPGHRANILSAKYQEIGAYAARGMYNGRMVWFAVQHFGTDRMVCPIINQTLKSTIDSMDTELTDRRAQIANEKAALVAEQIQDESYKERVSAFNELVAAYNTTLVLYQEKSKLYNAQVTAFNSCRTLYQ